MNKAVVTVSSPSSSSSSFRDQRLRSSTTMVSFIFSVMVATIAAVVVSNYHPTSAFTVGSSTTTTARTPVAPTPVAPATTTTKTSGITAYHSTSFLPRSSTLMNNEAETVNDSLSENNTDDDDTGDDVIAVPETTATTQEEEETSSPPTTSLEMTDDDTTVVATPSKPIRHTVYIGNLPFTTSPDDIRTLFMEKVGGDDIISIKAISMPVNDNSIDENTGKALSKGFCFVDVESDEQVKTAIKALDQIEFMERKIRANELKSKKEIDAERSERLSKRKGYVQEGQKKLYVGNLSFDAPEADLQSLFSEFGTVADVYIPISDGVRRGFAFITMAEEDADRAMAALDGVEFFDRTLIVNEPLKPGEKPNFTKRTSRSKQFKIYVGNLSFYTSKETLQNIFEEFGDVYDCYLPTDSETGRMRGFGFVSMEREAGENAIEALNEAEVDGRIINVNEARGKRRTPPEMMEQKELFDTPRYDDDESNDGFDSYDDETETAMEGDEF